MVEQQQNNLTGPEQERMFFAVLDASQIYAIYKTAINIYSLITINYNKQTINDRFTSGPP